jgi:hypothetical protein
MHYCAKRRLDLWHIFTRVRGGSSLRDIARVERCSPKAIANAVLRLGRQAMAAHLELMLGLDHSGQLCFDGLVSAVCSRDYRSQITTLADRHTELLLAMSHAVTERGGRRTGAQQLRIRARRQTWRPPAAALSDSIRLLAHELPRFAAPARLHIDTDQHPLYRTVLTSQPAIRWFTRAGMYAHHLTPGRAPRTTSNRLFVLNYLDRMIRHRVKEHTRESLALGRNSTMQMHRMWIFAWDHNALQPRRVAARLSPSRAEIALGGTRVVTRLRRSFFTRRIPLSAPLPESMRRVWMAELASPPVRWRVGQRSSAVHVTAYARRDLQTGYLHGG